MFADLSTLAHTVAFHGAITGIVAAAAVDIHAVVGFTQWHQLVTYNWSTASLRWTIGAVTGALTAVGYGALVS